ncbi:class I SAM-dependent methyltransferase [Amycolatopsis melonis]|uniref:class I SAM-dependent methyltransferase n=1 Tax=Amycolatopsis melonis TaxID=3156488 RepID=UPI003D6CBE49
MAALELKGTESALGIGFGGGLGLALLLRADGPRRGHFGNDDFPSPHDVPHRDRYRQLHEGSMTKLQLPDDAVHAIVSTNTIYFIDDLAAAFAEVSRVPAPGGRLVLGIGDPKLMAKSVRSLSAAAHAATAAPAAEPRCCSSPHHSSPHHSSPHHSSPHHSSPHHSSPRRSQGGVPRPSLSPPTDKTGGMALSRLIHPHRRPPVDNRERPGEQRACRAVPSPKTATWAARPVPPVPGPP